MMRQSYFAKLYAIVFVALVIFGCTEKIDESNRYVFKNETIFSYLSHHKDYSTYVDLLQKVNISKISNSKVSQLLAARGNYTVFAPNNEAIQEYLKTLVDEELITEPSWDAFTDSTKLDSIRKVIVYNSILDGGDEADSYYFVADFPQTDKAEFPLANLNDKKLSVHYGTDVDSVYINGDCPISVKERDILTINGAVHQLEKVIAPKDITAKTYIQDCLDTKKEGYLVCFRVIQACGLMDTLAVIRDEKYEELYQAGKIENLNGMTSYGFAEGSIGYAPKHRYYGFTIFAETDEYWRSQGIDPQSSTLFEDLMKWIVDKHQYSDEDEFVTDENYDDPKNLLYQWITYHILPMKIGADRLVFHINEYGFNLNQPAKLGIPTYEFYTTMGQRRLFKLFESDVSDGVFINRFAKTDNGRSESVPGRWGREIDQDITNADPAKRGARVGNDSPMAVVNDITNCCIYPIDAPISYNDDVRDNLMRQRIRFDGMSLFPEAMNNDIRLKKEGSESSKHVYIPNTVRSYNYFENMQQNEDMNFVYYNAWNDDWCNLHKDEMKAVGRFEVMFKLPPVPRRGTYEVRYKVLANSNRGIAQVYFGSDPNNLPVAGIPLDLTLDCRNSADATQVGWEDDSGDEDYDAEVDKRMRNNGYMKGPQSINSNNGTERGYNDRENIRHIFVRQTLDPNQTYYIKLKSVLDSDRKEFYMDFIEYCAKEVYDNPETPEDIW